MIYCAICQTAGIYEKEIIYQNILPYTLIHCLMLFMLSELEDSQIWNQVIIMIINTDVERLRSNSNYRKSTTAIE